MPKMAELREIDGALWARVEVDLSVDPGSVSLLTGAEVEALKREQRALCAELADDTATANQGHNSYYAGIRFGAKIIAEAIRNYK